MIRLTLTVNLTANQLERFIRTAALIVAMFIN